MKKKLITAIIALVVIVAIAAGVLFSGLLVMPTSASLAQDTPVKSHDILEFQNQRELDILADYAKGSYTLQNPYIIQDPYLANPLSALVLFETAQPAQVTVTVAGKDAYSTFAYTLSSYTTHHEAAILGLYAEQKNQVTLTVTYQNGQQETSQQAIQTEACRTISPP